VGCLLGTALGFGVGVGEVRAASPMANSIGDLLSAWVPVASTNPIFPAHSPAGIPLMLNFQEPLVARTTVCIGLGLIGVNEFT